METKGVENSVGYKYRVGKMKKKSIILKGLLISTIILLMTGFSLTKKNSDIFEDILKRTNSCPEEYGITAEFTTDENRENICDDILKMLDFYDGWYTNTLNTEQAYCVEFRKNNVSGYIETMHYENHSIVTINIIKKDNKNSLEELKNKLQECLEDKKVTVKYYMYLKSKMPNDNIDLTNKEILRTLKEDGATNINTISLQNGYSTTAYTKRYDSIESNGEKIDFNYAVCKYSSGSYIIIGTPEIMVIY